MKKSLFAIALAGALVLACKPEPAPVPNSLTLKSDAEVPVPVEGGTFTVEFEANVAWTAELDVKTDVAALNVKSGAAEDQKVKVSIQKNEVENVDRTITLTLLAEGVEPVKVLFKQASTFVPYFSLSESDATLDEKGGSVTIEVNTNILDWSLVIPEDAQTWIHLGEKVDNKVNVTVDPYAELGGEREAELEIAANGQESLIFTVSQNGPSPILWFVHPTEALEGFDPAIKSSLANIGENLIVSNGSKVYVLNALTGEVVNKIDLPEGMYVERLISDDAGNLLASVDVASGDLVIYKVDINNLTPEPFITYNTANLWVDAAGNIRVSGDITKNAEIVATAPNGYFLVWHVVDGVPSNWFYANTPYSNWSVQNCCTAPAGPSIDDGLYFIAYGGDYNLYYLDTFAPNSETNSWALAFETGSSGNENFNSIDVAEFKGTQYVGIVASSHFTYSDSNIWVLDATDKTALKPVLDIPCEDFITRDANWANVHWTDGGPYSDIILVPTESALLAGFIENNVNVLGVLRWSE